MPKAEKSWPGPACDPARCACRRAGRRGAHPQPGADQPRAAGGRDVFHRCAVRALACDFANAREGHRLRHRCGDDHRGGFVSGSRHRRGAGEGRGLQRADPLWRQCDHPHRRGLLARHPAGNAPRAGGGNAGALAGKSLQTRRSRAFPPGGRNHRRQHDDAPHPRRRGSDFAGDRSVHRAFSRRADSAIRRHRTRTGNAASSPARSIRLHRRGHHRRCPCHRHDAGCRAEFVSGHGDQWRGRAMRGRAARRLRHGGGSGLRRSRAFLRHPGAGWRGERRAFPAGSVPVGDRHHRRQGRARGHLRLRLHRFPRHRARLRIAPRKRTLRPRQMGGNSGATPASKPTMDLPSASPETTARPSARSTSPTCSRPRRRSVPASKHCSPPPASVPRKSAASIWRAASACTSMFRTPSPSACCPDSGRSRCGWWETPRWPARCWLCWTARRWRKWSPCAARIEVIELNLQPDFEDCYIDHLSLP